MRSFKLASTTFLDPPRCPFLDPADAVALVAFYYGQVFLVSRKGLINDSAMPLEANARVASLRPAEGLVWATFCAGMPWIDVLAATGDYVEAFLDEGASILRSERTDEHAVLLQRCLLLSLTLAPEPSTASKLCELSSAFAAQYITPDATERRLFLQFCTSVLGPYPRPELFDNVTWSHASWVEQLAKRDGARLQCLLDNELRELRLLGETMHFRSNRTFLERINPFQRFGLGLSIAAVRKLAIALGIDVPQPAPETLLFYPPQTVG